MQKTKMKESFVEAY